MQMFYQCKATNLHGFVVFGSSLLFLLDLGLDRPAVDLGREVDDGGLLFNGEHVDGLNRVFLFVDIAVK